MPAEEKIYHVPVKDITVSESNVRHTDKEARIDELAGSIEKHGLLQPVVLVGTYGSFPYKLIAGGRRFRAHQKLGKRNIRAIFHSKELGDMQAILLSLSENMHRVQLNDADRAEAITALYLHYKRNDRQVAQELGLPLRTVRDYIKIEERATPKAKRLLKEGKVKKADLKRVIDAAQGDKKKADRLLDILPRLSKYEKDRAVDYGKKNPESPADKIIQEGQKPRIEPTVILNLPKEIDNALNEAAGKLSMDRESVAVRALSEWLNNNGYLKSG
jgi:ParB family chromosome partitioning protein